jgi:DNA-binding NarL/FixJ family response regulator
VTPALTARELQIMVCVAEGWSAKMTAATLGLREQLVKNDLSHVYAKLNAHNGPPAIALMDDGAPGWRAWHDGPALLLPVRLP